MRFFTSFAIVETARPSIVAIWAKVSRHSSPWAMPFLVSRVMCFAMTSSFFVCVCRPRATGTPGPARGHAAYYLMWRRAEGGRSARRRDERPRSGLHCCASRTVSRIPSVESATRGVDAFDGTSLPHAARLCQSKRKTLPGEGRRKGNPLSTSIIHSTSSFGKLNKI